MSHKSELRALAMRTSDAEIKRIADGSAREIDELQADGKRKDEEIKRLNRVIQQGADSTSRSARLK